MPEKRRMISWLLVRWGMDPLLQRFLRRDGAMNQRLSFGPGPAVIETVGQETEEPPEPLGLKELERHQRPTVGRQEPAAPVQAKVRGNGHSDKVEQMLLGHAAAASGLARLLEPLEGEMLRFAGQPETVPLLGGTLRLVERVDRLRSGLVNEVYRAATLLHELDPSQRRTNVSIRSAQTAVLLQDGPGHAPRR